MGHQRKKLLSINTLIKFLKALGKFPLVSVDEKALVKEAVSVMDDRDFSQLPVMKDGEVVGIVTYEAVLRWARMMNWTKVANLPVSEIMAYVKITDHNFDLIDILDTLAAYAYVMVRMRNGEYEILTSYDALKFIRENSETFLVLNDIESNLREIISECFDTDDFRIAAERCAREVKPRVPTSVDDMTFGQYKEFILSNWGRFSNLFGNKQVFERYIERCREIRNNNFHFRHISEAERDFLKNARNWIIRKRKT